MFAQSALTANGASSVLTFSNVLQKSLSVSVTAADGGSSTYSLSAAFVGCPLALWVPVQENVLAGQYANIDSKLLLFFLWGLFHFLNRVKHSSWILVLM